LIFQSWEPLLEDTITLQESVYYTDAFYAECRAYGRIKEEQEKGRLKRSIAIPCHGYLLLQEEDLQALRDRGVDLGEDDIDDEARQLLGCGQHARAIVKDIASNDTGICAKNMRRVLADIRQLNQLKIYNKDIRSQNYRDGLLVDFGSSWTEPHRILDALDEVDKLEAAACRIEDLVNFDDMVEEEGIGTRVRALRNDDYCRKLRSRGRGSE